MANSAPPTITREGGGYVVTGACRWLRFLTTEAAARESIREHLKKCKTCGGDDE